jgi:hypothetical protein
MSLHVWEILPIEIVDLGLLEGLHILRGGSEVIYPVLYATTPSLSRQSPKPN